VPESNSNTICASVFDRSPVVLNGKQPSVRQPAVAGMFYPGDREQLAHSVEQLLAEAANEAVVSNATKADDAINSGYAAPPKAIIAPHAGYVYSGKVAASIYARIMPWRHLIRRVVLLGPAHRVPIQGLALPSEHSFSTPLGNIQLDRAAMASVQHLPQVQTIDAAHAQEHSLEVQLPFLQLLLEGGFTLVPLVVGNSKPQEVSAVLDLLWGGEETLIVISSDLSHFHPYAEAQQMDKDTCARIIDCQNNINGHQACGAGPINGLLHCALQRGLQAELVQLMNSGDTAGDKSRVVGYASFAFYDPQTNVANVTGRSKLGQTLTYLARASIHQHLASPPPAGQAEYLPELEVPGATFVTLTQDGRLRGCIGSLMAHRLLREDVAANAIAAATRDSRFSPLTVDELPITRVEVSLLSPPQPLAFASETEALSRLRPHVDGVIFQAEGKQSTFLPQVWEQLPDAETFMQHLKQKAGLAVDYWSNEVQLLTYQVEKWKEDLPEQDK